MCKLKYLPFVYPPSYVPWYSLDALLQCISLVEDKATCSLVLSCTKCKSPGVILGFDLSGSFRVMDFKLTNYLKFYLKYGNS